MLTIKVDTRQAHAMLNGLKEGVSTQAIRQAVNKAANKGNTLMKRAIAKEFNITQQALGPQLKVQGAAAGFNTITAVIYPLAKVRGKRSRNVIEFLERKVTLAEARKRTKSGTLRDLRFEIRRGRRVTIPGTFVVTANRGTFVAKRTGKARLPIQAVQTIDVPQMFNTKRIVLNVKREIENKILPEEMRRAIQSALKRYS